MSESPNSYLPPESLEELLRRYAIGERRYSNTDLSGVDFSGVLLNGASFDSLSWLFNAKFDGASLRGASFRECNVKCASIQECRPFRRVVCACRDRVNCLRGRSWIRQISWVQRFTATPLRSAMNFPPPQLQLNNKLSVADVKQHQEAAARVMPPDGNRQSWVHRGPICR